MCDLIKQIFLLEMLATYCFSPIQSNLYCKNTADRT